MYHQNAGVILCTVSLTSNLTVVASHTTLILTLHHKCIALTLILHHKMSNPNPTRTREFANTHTCVAIETLVSGHVAREWYSTYQCTRGSRSRVPLPADPGIGPDCRWRCFRSTPRGRFQGKGGGHSDSVCVCVCVHICH